MPEIRLEHVAKVYRNNRLGTSGTLELELKIRQGEFVFVTGLDGAGKSALMELLALRQEPDRGTVFFDDVDLRYASRRERRELSRRIGAVLRGQGLNPTETVMKNLASGSRLEYLKDKYLHRAVMEKALSLVGMAGRGERMPAELSEAERTRVELARAIRHSPDILVLDGILERGDEDTAWDLLNLLVELNNRGTTVILASGESRVLNTRSRREIVLSAGRVAQDIKRGRYA